jgi:hypothetical protein
MPAVLVTVLVTVAALGMIAACSPAPAATVRTGGTRTARPGVTATPGPAPAAAPPRVAIEQVRTADGSAITVATFSGGVRYALHNGSSDPGALAARLVREGPKVTGAERGMLLAAFNGGFQLKANVGGYEQEGHVIVPLRSGYASLIIDRSGQARIAVWGAGAPGPGEDIYSVRQNLPPLVLAGRPVPAAADWRTWGATLGGVEYIGRSALGEDARGDLIYVAGMSASPADLATVLVWAGARIGMELDINPNWVQLDVSQRPGGPLQTEVPGQWRPASQYLAGWTRDFIVVLG